MKRILWLAILGLANLPAAPAPVAPAREITTADQAFDHLFNKESRFPYTEQPNDKPAVQFLQTHPTEARDVFTERYLGKKIREGPATRVLSMIGKSAALDLARGVTQHYAQGDLATPFADILAARGDRQDMERLAALITTNPDASPAENVAALLLASPSLQARAVLARLGQVPGKWRIAPGVEKFLGAVSNLECTCVRAGEYPDWNELQRLLGRSVASWATADFIAGHTRAGAIKGDSGSYGAPGDAFTLMFNASRISTIILRASPATGVADSEGRTVYPKPLPGGLAPEDDRAAVERKLGAPTTPRGDQWISGELTIWVFFDQQKPRINELYVRRTKDRF